MGNSAKKIFWTAVGAVGFCAYAVKPRTKNKPDLAIFSSYDYANGGCHDFCKNAPENSSESFEAACKRGYGVVMSVRLSKDKVPVVFTDHELWRMCGHDGTIEEMTLAEIKQFRLISTSHHILSLEEALSIVDCRVPVLVQLKSYNENFEDLALSCALLLDHYEGVFAVESMDYKCIRWFMRSRPSFMRGQMLEKSVVPTGSFTGFLRQAAKNCMLTNCMCKPDFISVHIIDRNSLSLRFCRLLYHVPVLHWTVCTLKEYEQSRLEDAIVVFEDIEP